MSAGCGCNNNSSNGGAPAGSATGPLTPGGAPLNPLPCGCSGGSAEAGKIPWLLIALVVGFFVLVRKK
jgi:MYXO-CTERM domain-containing protein